jgi:catechol 2,3-dioxygenase-like lactoylglutathione lyase family enzyme
VTLGPLDHVYYWTTDMDRAVKFYEDVLGLRLAFREGSQWAEFEAGPVRLALHGAVEGRAIEEGGGTAVFRVEDLDASRARLEADGVEFEEHVGEVEGFARFASFRDPDGNVVQIIEYAGSGGSGGVARQEKGTADRSQRANPPVGKGD